MQYRTSTLFLLFLAVCLPLYAQKPAKRAKARTEQRASQRLDEKVDEGVEEAFSAIEGLFKKKQQPESAVPDADSVGYAAAGEASRSVLSPNPTPFSLVMNVTETKKNGKQTSTHLRIGATTDRFALIMVGEGSERNHMILNTEDGKTTMISTDKKGKTQGFRMRMPKLGKAVEDITSDMADYITITRTGERKDVDGYDCEKILVKDSKHNTTTESWVTQDIDLSYRDVFGGMAGMAGAGGQQFSAPTGPAALFEGFPVLSTTDDGKNLTEMHMTDIRVGEGIDRSLFDTGSVEIQELGFN